MLLGHNRTSEYSRPNSGLQLPQLRLLPFPESLFYTQTSSIHVTFGATYRLGRVSMEEKTSSEGRRVPQTARPGEPTSRLAYPGT